MPSYAEETLHVPETLEAAIIERNGWCDTALQHYRNEEFYRGIVTQIGEMFGDAAKTSDDGTLQDSVLALKVPELVRMELSLIEALNADIDRLNNEIERITRRQQGVLMATIPLTTETMSALAQPGQRAAEAEPSNVAGSHPAVSRKVLGPCAGSNPAGTRSVVNRIVAVLMGKD